MCTCVDPDILSLMFLKDMVTALLPLLDGSNRHHKGLTSKVHSNDFLAFMSHFSFSSSKEVFKLSHLPLYNTLSHIYVFVYGRHIYFRVIYKYKVPQIG